MFHIRVLKNIHNDVVNQQMDTEKKMLYHIFVFSNSVLVKHPDNGHKKDRNT